MSPGNFIPSIALPPAGRRVNGIPGREQVHAGEVVRQQSATTRKAAMRKFLRTLVLSSLVFVLVACGSVDNSGVGNVKVMAGNNAATLSDATIGTGESSTADLRKTLPLTLATPHAELELGTVYLTRISASSEYGSLIAEITNTGSSPRCFVKATNITYYSVDAALATTSSYAVGSVGKTSSGTMTDTCLDAGESGYLIDIEAPDSTTGRFWSDVVRVEIESLSTSSSALEPHGGRLKAEIYTISGGTVQAMHVTGQNHGSITLYPTTYSYYVMLDGAGDPVEWAFLQSGSDSVAGGQTASWDDDAYYQGTANAVHFRLDFEDEPQTASLRRQDAGPLSRSEVLELRNRSMTTLEERAAF